MSGTDHATNHARQSEDDDLFDFPLIELTSAGLRDASLAGIPASSVEHLASVAAPLPRETPSTQTTPKITPAKEPAPAIKMVAPVDPQPTPASAAISDESPAEEAPAFRQSHPVLVVVALVILFALNGLGFWYLWRMRVSFGTGIEEMRTELDDAAKRLERARRETTTQASTALMSDETIEMARISALERSALAMAEGEISGGDYAAARRRLNRLLAQADRMTPGLRAEIEPRAAYLVAQSYLDEAQARRGGKQ